jgi:hypothetical protein
MLMSTRARARGSVPDKDDLLTWVQSWLPFRDFLYLDLRSLALLRVLLGVVLLCDWTDRIPDLTAHYSDAGVFPRSLVAQGTPNLRFLIVPVSVHLMSGATWFQALLLAIACLVALALLVGYRTRLATFLSWFLLISVHARNPALLQGGDILLRMILFWSIFLPLGACFSVDAARTRGAQGEGPASWRVANLGTFAYIVQICLLYWFAAALKWDPEWRTEGTAVYYALNVDHLTTRFGQWLLHFPTFLHWVSLGTIWLETLGPALLFLPFAPAFQRLLAIACFLLFHLGLALSMALSNFPWVCWVLWLAILPTAFWDWWARRTSTPERTGLRIFFDDTRPRCVRVVALLRTFLLLPTLHWQPTSTDAELAQSKWGRDSWVVSDHQGNKHGHFDALVVLLKHSPLWWPVGYVLGWGWLRRAGEAFYRWQASRATRKESPGTSGANAGASPPPYRLGLLENLILGFLLVYVILWNVRDFAPETTRPYFPIQSNALGLALGLDQNWGLFAPRPGKFKGWYVLVGYLENGKTVDLMQEGHPEVKLDAYGRPTNVLRPALISAMYSNGRWRRYMMNLADRNYYPTPHYYLAYRCREWNATHQGGERLEGLVLWFMLQKPREGEVGFGPPRPTLVYPPPQVGPPPEKSKKQFTWKGLNRFPCDKTLPPAGLPEGFSTLLFDPDLFHYPKRDVQP